MLLGKQISIITAPPIKRQSLPIIFQIYKFFILFLLPHLENPLPQSYKLNSTYTFSQLICAAFLVYFQLLPILSQILNP